ncbi:hypothetical protein [Microbacterium sp. T32]|uniref:hypothetical protein n=1 Tax=Microbacterium sp. T32 TaxID=1776083 RepID=UPI001E397904|nr:hypothetical protein [Microbacterium sp. T32]
MNARCPATSACPSGFHAKTSFRRPSNNAGTDGIDPSNANAPGTATSARDTRFRRAGTGRASANRCRRSSSSRSSARASASMIASLAFDDCPCSSRV